MDCIICSMNQRDDCVKHFHHPETPLNVSSMVPLQRPEKDKPRFLPLGKPC